MLALTFLSTIYTTWSKAFQVTPLEIDTIPTITDYEIPELEQIGKKDYEFNKKKLGPLASTDPDIQHKNQKDQRFSLNPLVRDPLAVEQERRARGGD